MKAQTFYELSFFGVRNAEGLPVRLEGLYFGVFAETGADFSLVGADP